MRIDRETELPFKILVEGPFDPNSVTLHHTDIGIRHTPELDQIIEDSWQKVSGEDPNFRNDPKVLLRSVYLENDQLHLITGLTSFKERVATQQDEIVDRFGMDSVAVTLGATGIIETNDNRLVLAQRRTPHPTKRGGLHLIGGMIDLADINSDHPSVIEPAIREVVEETGIQLQELMVKNCLGLTQSIETYAADVLFTFTTPLGGPEIKQRRGDEEVSLVLIPNTPADLRRNLLNFLRTTSSPCMAGMYLYGKQNFGFDWAEEIKSRFVRRIQVYQGYSPDDNERVRARIERRINLLRTL